VGASKGAAAQHHGADGARSVFISNAHVPASRLFVDGHLWNDGNAHARAHHAQQAAELPALEHDLRMEARAVTRGNCGIAKTVAIAQEQEWFGAKVLERKGAERAQFVFPGERGVEPLRQQGECIKFVAAYGKRQDGDVHGAGAETLEKDRRNFFDDGELDLGKFARESREARWQEVRGNGGNHTNRDGPADEFLSFDDVTFGGLEFAKYGAGSRQKRFAEFGNPDGAAEPVEEARTELIFQLEYLLRKRRLGDVRLFGGAAEGAGFGDAAEIAELVKFHRGS